MNVSAFADAVEFAENPEPRCPCVLLLDTSHSMRGGPIKALNEGLQAFQQDLIEDDLAAKRVELSIVTFGGEIRICQEFVTIDQFEVPALYASGTTPLGAALHTAVDLIQARKASYRANGIAYYRPWLFLITDGAPMDEWRPAARRVRQEEHAKGLAFFAVGVEDADMQVLAQISSSPPIKLNGLLFGEMFVWLSRSAQSISHSKIGDQVALPPISSWGTV